MKKHPSLRRTQRSNHQSVGKLKAPPSKKTTKRVKPTRKFGDDLTNVSMFPICHQEKPCKKDVSVPKPNVDCLEDYHSDIENHLLQEDVDFYSYLTSTMEYAPNIKITSDMRKILIKWLVEVSNRFGCLSETLHMAIQLIDILLVEKGLLFDKKNFQLLGITSLFIACKYNQIQVPDSDKFLYVCDGLYQLTHLLQMEANVLLTINFNLQLPSIFNFLHIQMKNYGVDTKCRKFINEFSSYCLFDFNLMNNFKKSQIALLLIYFSTKVSDKKSMDSFRILQESGIEKKTLEAGIQIMFKLYKLYKKQDNTNQ